MSQCSETGPGRIDERAGRASSCRAPRGTNEPVSRHQVPLRPGVAASSAWIGWDRPFLTFFAQVFAPYPEDLEEEFEILWVGTSDAELPRPIDAIRLLEPYCDVAAEITAQSEI